MKKKQIPQDVSVVIPLTTEPDGAASDPLSEALNLAENVKIHVGAMLEVLRSVPPSYKIEAGLYLGNLQAIYDRLARLLVVVQREIVWADEVK